MNLQELAIPIWLLPLTRRTRRQVNLTAGGPASTVAEQWQVHALRRRKAWLLGATGGLSCPCSRWHDCCVTDVMTRQDVVFRGGMCRIEISDEPWPLGGTRRYVARMALVDSAGAAHPLTMEDGSLGEIHAESEELALSSAMTFLEGRVGALSLYPHESPASPEATSDPIRIDHRLV